MYYILGVMELSIRGHLYPLVSILNVCCIPSVPGTGHWSWFSLQVKPNTGPLACHA